MKDQLYFRLVEQSILNMRVTSFGLRFSQLSVLNKLSSNYNYIPADDCGFRCLRKINFIRIFILWKPWNLPANKVKKGDFNCDSSLSLVSQ